MSRHRQVEYQFHIRYFMEACKILPESRLTIDGDEVRLTTEDTTITGLVAVAKHIDDALEEHWLKD